MDLLKFSCRIAPNSRVLGACLWSNGIDTDKPRQ
jgi:hypothetical protein